jgi:glutathione S-transferase
MKLYFSPGTCSLAVRIVLHEASYSFIAERVDLKTRRTASGQPLATVNGKNYVPVLELRSGERLTEAAVILQYLADRKPESALIPPPGTIERYRAQEWLNFITSELHLTFRPLFRKHSVSHDWQDSAERKLVERFNWLTEQLVGKTYLMGKRFGVVDAYLFTVLNWTTFVGIELASWPVLHAYLARVAARPRVQEALKMEGLLSATAA